MGASLNVKLFLMKQNSSFSFNIIARPYVFFLFQITLILLFLDSFLFERNMTGSRTLEICRERSVAC